MSLSNEERQAVVAYRLEKAVVLVMKGSASYIADCLRCD